MFRYRCPHCRHVLQALEARAGKTTICSKCSRPLTIPAEKSEWLNERGEPLLASPTVVIPNAPPEVTVTPAEPDPDTDVLGAILVGAIPIPTGPPSVNLGAKPAASPEPAPSPAAAAARFSPPPRPPAVPDVVADEDDDALAPPPEKPEPAPTPAPAPAFYRTIPPPEEPPATFKPVTPPPARPQPAAEAPRPAEPAEPVTRTPQPPARTPAPRPVPTRSVVRAAPNGEAVNGDEGVRGQRSGRLATVTPPPAPQEEAVSFNETPIHLRTAMDIAVELTAALTTRMKPPPKPPRDLRPSTAIWLLVTGLALVLLALTLLTRNTFAQTVVLIGLGEIAAGYLWVVSLAFRRDAKQGLLAALPPATLWYLTRRKYGKYRPLRYVVTGAVLLALAWVADWALPRTRAWTGATDGQTAATPAADITTQPKLAQLRYYRDQRAFDSLTELLQTLARTDPLYSDEAKSRYEIAAELKALCNHPDVKVKVEAMSAYALWGGADARTLCLAATRSTNQEERIRALELLARWKDAEVARAAADRVARLGDRETDQAVKTLQEIGQPAERAVFPLLRKPDQAVRLMAIDVLAGEKVGGPESVAELRELAGLPDEAGRPPALARVSDDPVTRQKAAAKAQTIADRLKK